MLLRFLLTLACAIVGFFIALPLSYFFQSSIYNEMTWGEYINGGTSSLMIGAQFGALDIYRYSVIAAVISMIVIGRVIEWGITRKKPANKSH